MQRLTDIIILKLCLVFVLLVSCSEKEKIAFKVVRNPSKGIWARDESKKVHLSLELTLGVLEGDKNQTFLYPRGLAVDREGNLFILDSGNNRIQKFDQNGNFLMSIGREGQGPGEFLNPYDIVLDQEGNLYVADYGNTRVQCFDNNGQYMYSFEVNRGFIRIVVDSKGYIYLPYYTDKFLVHKFSRDGSLLNSFVETEIASMKGDPRLQEAYNRVFISVDEEDNIYVAYRFQNKIQKYNSQGKLLLEFSRDLPFKPTPIHMFQDVRGGTGVTGDVIYDAIHIGPDNLIYVLLGKYYPEKGRIIDRYNSNGEYLDSFWTGVQCYRFAIRSHNLYLLDSYDSLKMYRYSLIK